MFRKRNPTAITTSACGLSFDDRNGEIVIAEHSADGGFQIIRAVAQEPRAVNLLASDLRITLANGNAHTEPAQLPVNYDAPEQSILEALAIQNNGDESVALAYTLATDGRIVLTQADEIAVTQTVKRVEQWLEQQQPEHIQTQQKNLRIETRTRAIARLWRASHISGPPAGTTAILIIGDYGFAIGLLSEDSGLVYETEEMFERGAHNDIKCQHARDVFLKFIATPTLTKLKLPEVANAVVSAAENYGTSMLTLLRECPELDRVHLEPVSIDLGNDVQLDQPLAFAIGSLLDQDTVAPCNLAVTPRMRLDEIAIERQSLDNDAQSKKVRAATLALLIPFIAAFAFVLTGWIDNNIENVRLNSRVDEENTIGMQLAKDNADYESSKANFGAFRSLLDNLIALRQKQPAAHQLLNDLNQRWPADNSWSINEINVKGASVEIKGKTKNEQSITSFAKSLEFSNGLFTGILTRNNVEGNSLTTSAGPLQFQTPRSNVIEFTITSAYAPLAAPGASLTSRAANPDPSLNQPRPFTPPGPIPFQMNGSGQPVPLPGRSTLPAGPAQSVPAAPSTSSTPSLPSTQD